MEFTLTVPESFSGVITKLINRLPVTGGESSSDDGLVVLSLFDGMSCGYLALLKAGIKIKTYYASEIDKYASIVSAKNFPNIIRLGDVTKVRAQDLDRVDLVIGGSPCQGFSSAGDGLNLDDPRSRLFFEFVRLVEECRERNPEVKFLLENVKMKKVWQDVISDYIGAQPVKINSNLLSAQNRQRLYWTNIAEIPQPEDRGILLGDILEENPNEKYTLSERMHNKLKIYEERNRVAGNGFGAKWVTADTEKSGILTTRKDQSSSTYVLLDVYGKPKRSQTKAACLTGGAHSGGNHSDTDVLVQKGRGFNKGGSVGMEGKSYTVTSNRFEQNHALTNNERARRLTPTECERLQTVPDGYTEGVSDTQRYKMLGNGWTVDVIAWILGFLK